MNALAQLNSEHQTIKDNFQIPVHHHAASVPASYPLSHSHHHLQQHQQHHFIPKQLPEIPFSNRRLLSAYKKTTNPRHGIAGTQWSNAIPNVFQTVPPMIPPIKPILSAEKSKRLSDILAQSDSEDEKVIIPRSMSGNDIGKFLA
jgi:hypothetical protein